jgi:hypothetical protein
VASLRRQGEVRNGAHRQSPSLLGARRARRRATGPARKRASQALRVALCSCRCSSRRARGLRRSRQSVLPDGVLQTSTSRCASSTHRSARRLVRLGFLLTARAGASRRHPPRLQLLGARAGGDASPLGSPTASSSTLRSATRPSKATTHPWRPEGGTTRGIGEDCEPDCLATHGERRGPNSEGDCEFAF